MEQVQEQVTDFIPEKTEEIWRDSIREEIETDKPLIATTEDIEELVETFSSFFHTFNHMTFQRDNGRVFCEEEQSIYESLVKDILLPVLSRLDELGQDQWVELLGFSYKF